MWVVGSQRWYYRVCFFTFLFWEMFHDFFGHFLQIELVHKSHNKKDGEVFFLAGKAGSSTVMILQVGRSFNMMVSLIVDLGYLFCFGSYSRTIFWCSYLLLPHVLWLRNNRIHHWGWSDGWIVMLHTQSRACHMQLFWSLLTTYNPKVVFRWLAAAVPAVCCPDCGTRCVHLNFSGGSWRCFSIHLQMSNEKKSPWFVGDEICSYVGIITMK